MKKENGSIKFKSVDEFGIGIGLTRNDIALIKAKQELIEKIKKARIKKKISQKQLAEMLGTKQPSIARMESGIVSEVSFDFLVKIAMLLETSFTFQPKKFLDAA